MRTFALALTVLCLGCGPSPSAAGAGTAGGEVESGRAPVSGPARSYLVDGTRFRMRVDVTRIRRSPVAPDLASALTATESYRAWAGRSGLEPIRDLDAILVGSDGAYSDRRTIVLRYVGDEASIRDRILRMGVDRGVTPAWREESGYAVVDYPDPALPVVHTLVLTAPHEMVLAPADELSRILDVAADQAAHRAADEVVEPGLAFGPGEVLSVLSDDPMPSYPGYPAGPVRYRMEMTDSESGEHADVRFHGDFADEASCTTARSWLESQRAMYADHMLVRAAQLDRPLREAAFTQSGAGLDAHADFTSDELRRALGAMALFQATRGAR
jgi:hypothetical protein